MWKILLLTYFITLTRGTTAIPSIGDIRGPMIDGRIVGGSQVSIAKHPHQVSVRYKSCDACQFSHSCGGSIYDKSVIITAAHCLNSYNQTNFVVVAGTENRNGADGIIARIDKIIVHENFNVSTTDYDLALIFLSTPLPINDVTIAAVKLATNTPVAGDRSTATGWGTTTEGGVTSIKLQEAQVRIIAKENCWQSYGEERITETMLCAGVVGGGKDACQYDSGGPLLVKNELAGVISWGIGCARPDRPGVYASVAYFKDWIENTVKENS